MSRRDLSGDELEMWARGEAEAKLHRRVDMHASGERNYSALGVFLWALVAVVLYNVPAIFVGLLHLFKA